MSISGTGGGAGQTVTVFIVDDEPLLLDLARAILQPLGFDVRTFNDPQKAISAFADARPSLVVTDYAMGETTGMDLLEQCRHLNPRQKIMLLSGTVDERIYAARKDKPDRFMSKPYLVQDFVDSVRALATE